jgi:hypothetical protein
MPHHSDHGTRGERGRDDVDWYEWREDAPPPHPSWRDRSWSSTNDWPMTGPHLGKGPRGYRRSDDRIRDEVCGQLTDSGDVDATEIDVEVTEGTVTLTGHVDSKTAKREAEDLAYRVRGVTEVCNYIKVARHDETRSTSGAGGGLKSSPGGSGPGIWK